MFQAFIFTIPECYPNTRDTNVAFKKAGRSPNKQYIALGMTKDESGVVFSNDFKSYDMIDWRSISIEGLYENIPVDYDNGDYQALRKEILRVEEKFDLFMSNYNNTKSDYDLIIKLQKEMGTLKEMLAQHLSQSKQGTKK